MLEIALTPAAIAFSKIKQRRRTFFITAGDVGNEIDPPTGPAYESGLDKIVAHDVAAEGRRAGEVGQPGMLDERSGANDGIVAPITTIATMPVGQAGGHDGSIQTGGKLVGTRKEGMPIHHQRQGLDETSITIGFHSGDELDECLPGHQTVRI